MSNKRFEMFELRTILVRMRQGDSDRELAKLKLAGRDKLRQIRRLAKKQGWLDTSSPLPDNAVLSQVFSHSADPVLVSKSIVQPHRDQVQSWVNQGIQASTIGNPPINKSIQN